MGYPYKIYVDFGTLSKKWKQLREIGLFPKKPRAPRRKDKSRIVTVVIYSKAKYQKALEILGQKSIYDPKPKEFVVTYALTESDIKRGELGRYPPMSLKKAISITQRMLKGAYVQVTLTKNPCK